MVLACADGKQLVSEVREREREGETDDLFDFLLCSVDLPSWRYVHHARPAHHRHRERTVTHGDRSLSLSLLSLPLCLPLFLSLSHSLSLTVMCT